MRNVFQKVTTEKGPSIKARAYAWIGATFIQSSDMVLLAFWRRCVAKYFAVNEVVGKRMQVGHSQGGSLSCKLISSLIQAQQETAAKQAQPASGSGGGGGLGSFFGLS